MERPAVECGDALYEAVVFLRHFEDLPDPRQRAKVAYPLDEILLLCLLAVLAGAEAITDIARFGEKRRDLLRRFRPFADGTPAQTTSATSWPRSMPRRSSVASSPGWHQSSARRRPRR